jgi:hypothetical protein
MKIFWEASIGYYLLGHFMKLFLVSFPLLVKRIGMASGDLNYLTSYSRLSSLISHRQAKFALSKSSKNELVLLVAFAERLFEKGATQHG